MALTNAQRQKRYRENKKKKQASTVEEYNATQRDTTLRTAPPEVIQSHIELDRHAINVIEQDLGRSLRLKRLRERREAREKQEENTTDSNVPTQDEKPSNSFLEIDRALLMPILKASGITVILLAFFAFLIRLSYKAQQTKKAHNASNAMPETIAPDAIETSNPLPFSPSPIANFSQYRNNF